MATNEPSKPDNIIDIDPGKQKTIEEHAAPGQPLEAGGEVPGNVGETEKNAPPAPEAEKPTRRGRPPKADKTAEVPAEQDNRPPRKKPLSELEPQKKERKPRVPKEKQAAGVGGVGGSVKEDTPTPAPEQPPAPLDASRPGETEQIVYLNLSELHAFKNHPFGVRDDSEMKALVESVKNGGVNQPALVRPREDGGYEIIAGHRRQKASELAGYANMPCIVRCQRRFDFVRKRRTNFVGIRRKVDAKN